MKLRHRVLVPIAAVGLISVALPTIADTSGASVCPAPGPIEFEMEYVDETRAGGEPYVATHADGTLLWGSHAGTTHFFTPAVGDTTSAAFLEKYEGQTYQYFSEDGGETWEFVPRSPVSAGVESGLPNSGFSDPDFAIDKAGNIYISEINLANIAVSKSTDGGRSYTLQNVMAVSMTDRQWTEADEEDVVWFVGNTFGGGSPTGGEVATGSLANRLYKSTDGGATWSAGYQSPGGGQRSSEIRVDKTDGRLYQINPAGSELRMSVFPNARDETPPEMTEEQYVIADGFNRKSPIGPTFDLDRKGNLYVTWDEAGQGVRPPGIYYSYSTDRGRTWAPAQRVNIGENVAFWPWIAVGDTGGVVITWLQNDTATGHNTENVPPESGWNVMVAQTRTGLGCGSSPHAGFTVTQASSEPVHHGTVCNSGTTCQATLTDRRLGDYISIAVDADGNAVVATSDTRQGGAVALPLMIRQISGPRVGDGREPMGETGPGGDPGECGKPPLPDQANDNAEENYCKRDQRPDSDD